MYVHSDAVCADADTGKDASCEDFGHDTAAWFDCEDRKRQDLGHSETSDSETPEILILPSQWDSTVYYTTDGTKPTTDSPVLYVHLHDILACMLACVRTKTFKALVCSHDEKLSFVHQ